MSAEDRAVGPPERLHPLLILTGLGGALRGMLGGYAAVAYLAATGRLGLAVWGAGALLVFTLASVFIFWRCFEFRVGQSEIRIDSGLLSRTHRSIPFDRVQDVDISQGPVARLLGIAKVRFETGAAAGPKSDEGVLHAINLERAQELRELVRASRLGTSAAPAAADEAGARTLFAMSLDRLLLAGVFNFSLALFAGLAGLSQTFGEAVGIDPFSRSFWNDLLAAGSPIADYLLAHRVASAAAGLALLVLVGVATGVVRSVLRDYAFRLERTDTGFRRRRGLLTLTDVTLPIRRAQAAIVATGPVRDLFGWRELKLQNLARDESSGDHLVAPLANDEEVEAILDELGWSILQHGTEWSRVAIAYLWSFLLYLLPLFAIAVGQFFLLPVLGVAGLLVLTALVLIRTLEWRRLGYALGTERLFIRSGWWRRRTVVLPLGKIQSIDWKQSFIERLFGTASLVFGVAGGSGFSAHQIPALPEEKARDLRFRLLSKYA